MVHELDLGEVVGTFSFRGEVRVRLHNPSSDLLRTAKPVILVSPRGERRTATMSTRPGAGGRVLGRIDGVTDEDGANALRGWRILIATTELPSLGDGEYYVWQLEGCDVHIDGAVVGRVVGVQEAGPNEVLEIETPDGVAKFVPMVGAFVSGVDVDGRIVHLAPGALDEDEEEPSPP